MKKTLSTLLCALMAMLMFTASAYASTINTSTFSFNEETGALVIKTQAGLADHEGWVTPSNVKSLVIKSDITLLKGASLNGMSNLETLVFEGDITLEEQLYEGVYYFPLHGATNLKEITFGGKASLYSGAFSICDKLEKVTFADAANIGSGAFSFTTDKPNTKLKELVFPVGSTLGSSVFTGCTALESVVCEGDATIGYGSFYDCTALKTLDFKGESIIHSGSFGSSVNIETIHFGKKTQIDSGIFSFPYDNPNTKLKELVFPAGSSFGSSFGYLNALESVVFEGDINLPGGSFNNLPALKSIDFKGESNINPGALYGSVNLEQIGFGKKTTFGSGALNYTDDAPNTKLKELVFPAGSTFQAGALYNCAALESIVFEGDVVLNGGVLGNCSALKSVEFKGESVLNSGALLESTNLQEVIFGKKTTLGGGMFFYSDRNPNTKLKEVVIPAGSTFSSGCFAYCNALESIVFEGDIDISRGSDLYSLPALKTVEFKGEVTLGLDSLTNATSLQAMIFHSENAPTFSGLAVFETVNDSAVVYVPCFALDTYMAAFEQADARGDKADLEMVAVHDLATDKDENGHWTFCRVRNCEYVSEVLPHNFGQW
ncbi:MAG: leucine-rich repeat protein, partial [Oscillospiraceae bacterium]|nr:leucine-rich repeat protein [Oscillospiraceae bacterium]